MRMIRGHKKVSVSVYFVPRAHFAGMTYYRTDYSYCCCTVARCISDEDAAKTPWNQIELNYVDWI